MATQFQKDFQIRFQQADPAGILFFGNLFGIAHEAFEDFVSACGIGWKEYFRTPDYFIPIRHTECNYLSPFFPGHIYTCQVGVRKMSQSSFQMQYRFFKQNDSQSLMAEIRMVHTVLHSKTKEKCEIPEFIRLKLTPYLESENV